MVSVGGINPPWSICCIRATWRSSKGFLVQCPELNDVFSGGHGMLENHLVTGVCVCVPSVEM